MSARGLAFDIVGDGPPLVFLHGWGLSRELWTYQEDAFGARYTVVIPDLPGFGGSAGLAGPYDLARYTVELRELLRELALGPASVVGFAFGGAVAMSLANEDPSLIAALVLVSLPSGSRGLPYAKLPRAMRRDWPDFAAKSVRAMCKQPQSEATLAWLTHIFADVPLRVAIDTCGALATFEPAPLATGVGARTLLVHGSLDDVVPVAVSEECLGLMPQAKLTVIEGAGHLVPWDRKEALNEAIAAFLAPTA